MGTGYQQDKNFWVRMGTGFWLDVRPRADRWYQNIFFRLNFFQITWFNYLQS